ncbi:putative clathrin assembly protein [Camellia lanceoleosa]|nr:putative clathrin assembly protein [Camellia lanceoleosa]
MLEGGTQKSLRKALGAIKDSTTVNLAKVNSDYMELDIAIVKSTNHVERPAKEKHIRAIFAAILATRPRADIAYCIHALATQLSKTHNNCVMCSRKSYFYNGNLSYGAHFCAKVTATNQSYNLKCFQVEYMSLPAIQYSVLDAESIERVDNSTFRCYVYNFKFFAFEVCPVLLLEGSPIVVAQNEKIDGKKFIQILFVCCKMVQLDSSMVNRVSCDRKQSDSSVAELTSDTVIEVSIEIPFAF